MLSCGIFLTHRMAGEQRLILENPYQPVSRLEQAAESSTPTLAMDQILGIHLPGNTMLWVCFNQLYCPVRDLARKALELREQVEPRKDIDS